MATTTPPLKAFVLSRIADLSLNKPLFDHLTPPHPAYPPLPRPLSLKRRNQNGVVCCLVSDTRNNSNHFDRGFSVISHMLRKIEPLDTSVISKAVSDSSKDSMKQTISTMLGLLPSDDFSVSIRVSKQPLHRLLVSSIVTGYTLWNAEYRVSLMRNLEIPMTESKNPHCEERERVLEEERVERESDGIVEVGTAELEMVNVENFGDLSPEALSYIQQLELELAEAKEELDAQKQENLQLEENRGNGNDLLEYLRSLESNMVAELSRPSSSEVREIIHQLVQNILQRFFKDDSSEFMGESAIGSTEKSKGVDDEICVTISTSRDYLAKLLFWCMLLGHHLRGLENRLHLSCVVGLL
ncbi:Protein of unknown function DUF760 [Dillenia turbinata]|uniref:Uncharacterized protein n=1 Tax=Dillenia turbinata TaxID=194707 RepID=A0AAN8Z824_9MAGN